MKKIIALFALTLGLSSLAHAGILVEPYLGYNTGDLKYTQTGTTYKDTVSGTALGLRLGYKFLLPWVALDYTGTTGKSKVEPTWGGTYGDFNQTSLGAVVGVDLPLIRPFAGYGFSNQLTYKGTGGTADEKFKGTYLKVGAGLGFIPFVYINIEYIMNNYDKVDVKGSGEVSKSSQFSDVSHNTLMFNVSLPLNL